MRILSFDIGSYSIKATELDVTFGRVELASYVIEKVVESELEEVQAAAPVAEATPGAIAAPHSAVATANAARQLLTPGQISAIRRIISDREYRYDRLVVNFPKAWVTTRLFNFPTKDRKAIQNSLTFELDDDIPFSMNDIVYDFALLNPGEGIGSNVFAAVSLRSDVTSLLSDLNTLGLDPDTITLETWGLSHVLKRVIPKEYEGRPICIVNIGHKQTAIHMYVGDEPVVSHVCLAGGADVTRAIAQAYNIPYDQAEKSKVDGAFLLTQTHLSGDATGEVISDDQSRFASVIADSLSPIVREIKQTLMSYKSVHKHSPRAVFITGGTSLIPNMQLFLEEQLKIPVFSFAYMSHIVGQTLQLSEASEAQIASATGLALTVAKVERNRSINFRKDEFSKKGAMGAIDFKAFSRPLKYVAASLAFVYLNLAVQALILSSRAEKQEELLERSIKSVVGAVSPSVMGTYRGSPATLKAAVSRELAKYKSVQVESKEPQISAYELLNKVSAAIPKDMTLDVSLFEVKESQLRVEGVVDQMNNHARIAKALEESNLVTEINKTKTEEDPKTRKVKFEIKAKVATGGEARDVKTR